MNTTLVKIWTVKRNTDNPRTIKDEKFEKLVQSIKEFPKMLQIRPIVVNDDMVVLGGNMRLRACKEAGLKEVYIIKASDLTEEEQRRFIIVDNVGFGEWDYEILANEWDADQLADWGLDVPEITVTEEENEEDDFDMPDEVETDIVQGDLFQIGDHVLLCGDSTKVETWERVMQGQLADLVMTDPPYNVNYEGKTKDKLKIDNDQMDNGQFYQFLLDFYTALGAFTKPGGAWYVWHADSEGVNFRTAMETSGLLMKQCLIWVKNVLVMGRQDYHWKHEPCLYGWKPGAAHYFTDDRTKTTVIEEGGKPLDFKKLGKPELIKMLQEITGDKEKSTVIRCDKPSRNAEHPTMKPIMLFGPLIQNSSRPGEIVADAFLGSGSTMVACHQIRRRCYGMELDPKYCQVIIDRMRKLDPDIEITRNGETF